MADYAVIMGGTQEAPNIRTDRIEAFTATDTGVERVNTDDLILSSRRADLAATSCNGYILAMGGVESGVQVSAAVDVFKATEGGLESFTPSSSLTLSVARTWLAAASSGNFVLAMGGIAGQSSNAVDVFQVMPNNVQRVADHDLSLRVPRYNLAAASAGNYILAMGGLIDLAGAPPVSNTVDIFQVTSEGVIHSDVELQLSVARSELAAASCNGYILAMGGTTDGNLTGASDVVDVFRVTANGVEKIWTDLQLSAPRAGLAAVTCGEYIFAMGGYKLNSGVSDVVDAFKVTASGVEKVDQPLYLRVPRAQLTAASCGNFVLAMGGIGSSGSRSAIDVFEIKQKN